MHREPIAGQSWAPVSHSLISTHFPEAILNPSLHLHRNDPITLTQSAPGHAGVFLAAEEMAKTPD